MFSVAPVPTDVPPQLPVYHLHVAPDPSDPPVTLKVMAVGPQSEVEDAVAPVGATESELTVMEVVAVTTPHPPPAAMV